MNLNLNTSSFFNSTEVNISSRMNEYLKKNFGYEVEGDFDTLQEARKSLQAEQLELKDNYMSAKYIENMLMIETISSLLKAHGESSESIEEDNYIDDGKFFKQHVDGEISSEDSEQGNEKVIFDDGEYSVVETKKAEQATRATIVLRQNGEEIAKGFWEPIDDAFVMAFDDGSMRMFGRASSIVKFMKVGEEKYYADRKASQSESLEEDEDDGMLRRQDGEYDKDEIRQMQYQQNVADPLNREIDSSQKAVTIEVDYDLELDKPKSENHLLKKHYKEMRKFNVFISMPEWQEGPPDSGFGAWTAKVRGSKKNLLGWLKAWEFDYDKEQLDDMGLGESVNAVQEADEEKGPEHYRYVSDSQLSHAKDKLEALMSDLDYAISYRSENSNKFSNGFEERAGVGSLMRIKSKLEEINDSWDESTEIYYN